MARFDFVTTMVVAFFLGAATHYYGYTAAIHQRVFTKLGQIETPRNDWPPATDHPIEFTADFYGLKYRGRSDNLIDFRVIYYGAFEKPMLYFLRDAMQNIGQEVFVDVGANVGQHSMWQ